MLSLEEFLIPSEPVADIPIGENREETLAAGTPDFPLAVYHDDLKKNVLGYVNWHWNKELQFCRVVEGTVRFYAGKDMYELSAGDGIFINAGILHMAKPLPGQNGIYICVMADASLLKGFPASVFDARYVTPFLSSGDFDSVVFHMDTPWQAYILRLITDISNLRYMSHYAYELDVQSNLYRIWSLLLKNLRPTENGSKKKSHSEMALNAMITYIGEHYTERIRIEDLAKAVSYSPGECCRIFRKRLGVTVSQYITAYRVERSTALLSDPSLSIADVAYACGFCGTSYYIRHFKALTGKTPLQYRRSGA